MPGLPTLGIEENAASFLDVVLRTLKDDNLIAASPAFNLKDEAEALSKGGPASTENFREQPVAHGAIGIEDLLAIALGKRSGSCVGQYSTSTAKPLRELERLVIALPARG